MVAFSFAIFLVAVGSQFVGCGLGTYRLGWGDATRVGVGMIPRGEVGMVVAQLGLSLGVISGRIYDAVVFMAMRDHAGRAPAAQVGVQGTDQSRFA